MSNYNVLKAAIQDVVKENGNNEITGALLQQTLLAMVNSLGDNYQLRGVAVPTTNPGVPDQNVFYFATQVGEYPNFTSGGGTGTLSVADGEVAIFKFNGTSWSKEITGIAPGYAIESETERAQQAETEILDLLSSGYLFKGVATTTTNPGVPDQKVFYIATEVGEYDKFLDSSENVLSIAENEVAIFKFNGTSWVKEIVDIAKGIDVDKLSTLMHVLMGDTTLPEQENINFRILSGGSGWAAGGTCQLLPVSSYVGKSIIIKANSEYEAKIAFLTNNNVVIGARPNFSSGTSLIHIGIDNIYTGIIPNDCQYLYVYQDFFGDNHKPNFILVSEGEIDEIKKDIISIFSILEIDGTSIEWETGGINAQGSITTATNRIRTKGYLSKNIARITKIPSALNFWVRAFEDDVFASIQPIPSEVGDVDFIQLREQYPNLEYRLVAQSIDNQPENQQAAERTLKVGVLNYANYIKEIIPEPTPPTPPTPVKIDLAKILFYPYKFKPQAHRGVSDIYPQNTLIAFEAAAQQPFVYGIETDVQMTSDGVLVLFHDDTLDNLTTGTGPVSSYTFEELQDVVYDNTPGASTYPNQHIPKFEDYLKICRKYGKVPYIELKALRGNGIAKTLEMVEEMGFKGRAVFTSFSLSYVLSIISLMDTPSDYIVEAMFNNANMDTIYNSLQDTDIKVIRLNALQITDEIVRDAHKKGYLIDAWGLNVGSTTTYNSLIDMGVEGATCNNYQPFFSTEQ